MKIKLLGIKDLFALTKAWREYKGLSPKNTVSVDLMASALCLPHVNIYATMEGKYLSSFIIFFVQINPDGDKEVFIDHLWVKPSKRRKGIAKILIGAAKQHALQQDIQYITMRGNGDSFNFALKEGFTEEYKIFKLTRGE